MENFEQKVAACHPLIVDAVKLLSNNPALMTYYSLTELKPVKNEKVTMRLNVRGTGSTAIIEYNPDWMLSLGEYSLVALCIYGEVLRLALHHCTTRKLSPIDCFKAASDYIVFENMGILNMQKEEVREAAKEIPTFAKISNEFIAAGLTKEKDWFLERVFAFLKKQQEQNQEDEDGGNADLDIEGEGEEEFGSAGAGECSPGGNGKSSDDDSDEANDKDSKNDDSDSGKGKGKSKGDSDEESDEDSDEDSQGKALKKHFDPSKENAETATAEWDENTMLDENVQEITEHIASDTSMWGNVSGNLKQMILAANAPKFDPTAILRRFQQSVISADHEDTRSKVNRRHGWVLPGERVTYSSKILFAEDVSGSMPDEIVAKGMAMVNKFVKHCEIDYCAWDGECGQISKIRKEKKEFNLVGRGCTNPQCVLDKLDEIHAKYDGIVFFTDAEFNWDFPGRKWAKKVFVITTEQNPPEWVRYKIHMKDLENREF